MLRVSIQEPLPVIPSFVGLAVCLSQVSAHSLGQEEAEPGGQHGAIYLGRNSDYLGYHLAKLQLPAHTLPRCFLSPLLQQSLLGFFSRKMAKGTPEIVSEWARR